jgi:hypothetical protein
LGNRHRGTRRNGATSVLGVIAHGYATGKRNGDATDVPSQTLTDHPDHAGNFPTVAGFSRAAAAHLLPRRTKSKLLAAVV